MDVISLQSGSNGNCFYVKAGDKQFLFDAGITGATAEQRLAVHGRDIREVDGLFISHGHRDHCQAMGVFHRKFKHSVFLTEGTLQQARRDHKLGVITDMHFFRGGETVDFGDVQVHTVVTPHDADDSVAFVIEYDGQRLGILTDIGHAFPGMSKMLQQLDAVIIESNFDDELLRNSRYPVWLKRRVSGKGGHLSNAESAQVLLEASVAHLQWICLCHLSEENNRPDLAIETHQQVLGNDVQLHVASRYGVGDLLTIGKAKPNRAQGPWSAGPVTSTKKQLSLF